MNILLVFVFVGVGAVSGAFWLCFKVWGRFRGLAGCPRGWCKFFFPNETSFWGTPLRIKEKASDRWEHWISIPTPVAVSWCAFVLPTFPGGPPESHRKCLGAHFAASGFRIADLFIIVAAAGPFFVQ